MATMAELLLAKGKPMAEVIDAAARRVAAEYKARAETEMSAPTPPEEDDHIPLLMILGAMLMEHGAIVPRLPPEGVEP